MTPVNPTPNPPPTTPAGSSTSEPNPPVPDPVDCAPLTTAGFEVCESDASFCGVVFTDGSGCSQVCAAAGLQCGGAYENADDACAADLARPAIDCDSGHDSDYCRCVVDPGQGGTAPTPSVPSDSSLPPSPASSSSAETSSEQPTEVDPPPVPGDAPCAVPDYIFSDTNPIGWASQGSGTTGGRDASPVLVTSLSALQSEVSGTTPKVIYVSGDLTAGGLVFGSNKTVIGCSSGAHIRGHVRIGSGSSNIILRNLQISGYAVGNCALDPGFNSGEGCSSGNDAVGINGNAHHIWVDHCSVKDGADGNLDITNDADFVTVSWTKFSYTPRTDNVGSDSTGAAGHRFSNLVGGTDSAPTGWPGTIPLNVTWHHNWWAENVVERQPRVRYGRNHLFNNYYNSQASNYCVRAGIEASILLQGNYFDGVKSPHQFNNDSNEQTAYIALGDGAFANRYSGVSGDQETQGGGETFEPPYAFTVEAAADVPAVVRAGAGPH